MAAVKRVRRQMRRNFQSVMKLADKKSAVEYAAMREAINGMGFLVRCWQAAKLVFRRF